MTREEAIKELSYIADEMPSMECADWKDAISMAIKALGQEQKWIPVTERLPEENGGYLVTVKRGYVTTALWIGNAENWKEVTAWMPLPQPYKAESEE